MNEHDEDLPLGVPIMNSPLRDQRSLPELARSLSPTMAATDHGRHPEDEVGLAKQLPVEMHAPTEDELKAIQAGEESELSRMHDEATQAGLSRFDRWGQSADRTLLFTALAFAALLSLFVFSQTFQILAAVAVQPAPIQWLTYAGLTAIFGTLAVFSTRLLVVFLRLRANQQISAVQLRGLSRRAELRALVQRDKAQAKANLEDYMRGYPLDPPQASTGQNQSRLDPETLEKLRNARDYLLDQERFSDFDGWLHDFRVRFQEILQGSADTVVQKWMKLAGLKTAISSSGMIDSIIVLYCSYGMIGDLCCLYNLRMTRPGIIRLMAFTLFNAYVAGQVEEHADELGQLAEDFDPGIGDMVSAIIPKFVGDVPGFALRGAGKKAADGLANALLMRKLGRMTIALLRPIAPG